MTTRPTPGERGRTTVTARAVERIAEQAAHEVGGTGGPGHQGVALPGRQATAGRRARASATLDGRVARLRLVVSLPWGAPAFDHAQQVRLHVVEQVARLADVTAVGVDVDVDAFHVAADPRRRVR